MDKRYFLLLSAALATGACTFDASAQLVINEVMQSNVYCIMDDINEFPDSWAEIYNTSETPIDLLGYKIGLKKKDASAYTIPVSAIVPPRGYVLIYCDKVGDGLHADFRIDSGKGDLYLFDPDGNVIDQVSMKKMPAPDVAYGRTSDGADSWGYQLKASPNASNRAGVSDVVLPEVIFSTPGGIWQATRTTKVGLEMPADVPSGSYIIYTTDGHEPTLANSKTYTKEISIHTSQVIRAKIVCDGAISRPSNAQSYVFLGREPQIPVVSIAIDREYLYDYNIGIFADGPGGPTQENYRFDWRRPINIEYFEPGSGTPSSINQLGETRVQGGYTRGNALKSLAVYANKRFGTKRFEYELWHKDKPGITDNKSFILRNGGNDFTWGYVRDALIQRVIGRNTNIDWQGYTPVIVLINGQYHAMLALRERSNEDNIAANYDGLEDIDMVENWEEMKAGSYEEFQDIMTFIYGEHTFDQWAERINLESYTNLMAINYWVYNTDFPLNNIVMWRRNDGVDGRWQWLVKDCDFGLGAWNSNDNLYANFHQYLYSNSTPSPGFDMYQNLMKCPEFKSYYVDHLVAYMGDFLNATTFQAYLNEICEENHGEQQISHDIWAKKENPWWQPNLSENIRFMGNWISNRESALIKIMQNSWGLGAAVKVSVNADLTDEQLAPLHIYYTDSEVPLTHGRFVGNDYKNRTIVVSADDDDPVIGWDVKVGGDTRYVEGKTFFYTPTNTAAVFINARIGEDGVNDILTDAPSQISCHGATVKAPGHIEAYDMAGRIIACGSGSITLPAKGVYVIRTADGASRKVVY